MWRGGLCLTSPLLTDNIGDKGSSRIGGTGSQIYVNGFFISENVSSINVLADSPRCWSWCKSNHHPDQPAERQCSHTEHLQCQVVALSYLSRVSCFETRGVDVYQRAGQGDLDRGDLEQWLRLMDYLKTRYQQFHI